MARPANAEQKLDILTEAELCAELGVSRPTLRRWRKAGIGPAFTRLYRKPLYRRTAVLAWLESRETTPPRSHAA